MKQVQITASEFKSKCLHLMDEIARDGTELVITKHGKPVSKLVPYVKRPESLFGAAKGKLTIIGDIVSPLDIEWNGDEENVG